ncbi:MAG: hypothetical protein PHX40_04080 [Bacilli bacterium]|nr:hypothetical protein [Bacilli bacterium]
MKIEKCTITYHDEGFDDYDEQLNIAIFTADDVKKALKAKEKYSQERNAIWKINPSVKMPAFVKQHFGEPFEDCDGFYLPFEGFKGTNKAVTDELIKLFSELVYTDNFRQCGTALVNHDDIILIDNWDY